MSAPSPTNSQPAGGNLRSDRYTYTNRHVLAMHMTASEGPHDSHRLSPEETFAVLGNATRLEILTVLAAADDDLGYADIFEQVEYDDSANFAYHLDRLRDHFIRKSEDGYALRIAGERVVEAMYSGVLTDHATVNRSEIGYRCMYCGGPTEMAYHDELAVMYCTECDGRLGEPRVPDDWPISGEGIVGWVSLPPAGVSGRTPSEIVEAAGIWTVADIQAKARGVCPRCSAAIDQAPIVCEDHETSGQFCHECDHQFAVSVRSTCSNCPFETTTPFPTHALGELALLDFMSDHGIDPFVSNAFHLSSCQETVIADHPLEATYTFRAEGEAITLRIDDELSVIDVSRHSVDGTPAIGDQSTR